MVGVHDPDQLAHRNKVLEQGDPGKQDIILVAVRPCAAGRFKQADDPAAVVGAREARAFTTAAAAAEDAGKPVVLAGPAGDRPYETVLQAAMALQTTQVVVGASQEGIDGQEEEIRHDWELLADEGEGVSIEIMPDSRRAVEPGEVWPDRRGAQVIRRVLPRLLCA